MAYDSRVYRILIASPSDVSEEREAAVRVMQDWNNLNSNNRKVVILPLRWETHTAPEYNVRPQEAINRRIVDDCDLVVGIFWTKLGQPTGEADSGTLEEIERVAKAGKPVMLYFSHVPVDPDKVDLAQLERLRGFKKNVLSNALIETFSSALDFRDKFANQLELKIRDLQRAEAIGQPKPLELQFLSSESGKLEGSSTSTIVELPELSSSIVLPDDKLKPFVERVFNKVRREAGVVPVALTIVNTSPSGIRNLYVEMSIEAAAGIFEVSHSNPIAPAGFASHDFFWTLGERSEVDKRLAKLTGEGLNKEGTQWKYSFEWDALQPQRVRLVQPFIYLEISEACKAVFSAKVYADSFASPIILHADLSVAARLTALDMKALFEQAERMARSAEAQTNEEWIDLAGKKNIVKLYQ